jgi:hypothetical protein
MYLRVICWDEARDAAGSVPSPKSMPMAAMEGKTTDWYQRRPLAPSIEFKADGSEDSCEDPRGGPPT